MQVFVYEYFTGGGAGSDQAGEPATALVGEAVAMVRGVTADFAALAGVRVVTTRDRRLESLHPIRCTVVTLGQRDSELEVIARLASESDWTLLIAPETAGALATRARVVEGAGGRLLSPGSEFIEIAANKQLTIEALFRAAVPVPAGFEWTPKSGLIENFRLPMVAKPIDGCGSQDVRLVSDLDEFKQLGGGRWRVDEFVPGLAASVSVLCGPKGNWPLPACEQRLSGDGYFSYLGGRLPLPEDLNGRAWDLAMRAVQAVGPTIGYVGMDLVLGEESDGSGDRVIEINPRLTTSYVGLRAAARRSLAAAMLAIAGGGEADLSFGKEPVEFTAAGEVFKSGRRLASER